MLQWNFKNLSHPRKSILSILTYATIKLKNLSHPRKSILSVLTYATMKFQNSPPTPQIKTFDSCIYYNDTFKISPPPQINTCESYICYNETLTIHPIPANQYFRLLHSPGNSHGQARGRQENYTHSTENIASVFEDRVGFIISLADTQTLFVVCQCQK